MKVLGTPQGATNLCVVQSFSLPWEEVGAFRSTFRKHESLPQPSTSQSVQEQPKTDEATRMYFSCPEEGCTKMYQSFTGLQKHLDVGKHLVRLERETTYDAIKRKWVETCKEVSRSYLHKESCSSSRTVVAEPKSPVSKGWALKT